MIWKYSKRKLKNIQKWNLKIFKKEKGFCPPRNSDRKEAASAATKNSSTLLRWCPDHDNDHDDDHEDHGKADDDHGKADDDPDDHDDHGKGSMEKYYYMGKCVPGFFLGFMKKYQFFEKYRPHQNQQIYQNR